MPNVSLCKQENEVHYNPYVPPQPIIYYASAKLTETTSQDSSGLHTNAFNTTIKSHTFENGVGTIEFDDDVTSIGNSAFYRCSGITSIVIPDSVTSIDYYAFGSCSGLTSIDIPNSVTNIGGGVFRNCTSLTSINIPSGVTSIGNYAFNGCTSLTSIEIPDSVTSIGDNAFSGCTSLTSCTIGNGVIGENAFYNCRSLTNCTIGSGVTSIGWSAFQDCRNLTSIISLAMTAPTIQVYTFYSIKTGGTLTVPSGSSGYDTWMGTGNYYLGKYNWTKVEQ